ncbi:hypothetical protein [Klebsiella pneumoniae]|uniref:hypothetical protein n=1 Tax=Klebsiella pneumoniae TaxID=573 RepID=UPI003B283410
MQMFEPEAYAGKMCTVRISIQRDGTLNKRHLLKEEIETHCKNQQYQPLLPTPKFRGTG